MRIGQASKGRAAGASAPRVWVVELKLDSGATKGRYSVTIRGDVLANDKSVDKVVGISTKAIRSHAQDSSLVSSISKSIPADVLPLPVNNMHAVGG
jgi:hypothetical protein